MARILNNSSEKKMLTINFSAKEDEFRLSPPSNADELRWRCGYNIGNWLFTSGVNNLISQDNSQIFKTWFSPFKEHRADSFNYYSSRVINVSNWIHADNMKVLEAYTEQIRRHNIPTYLLGIGAQIKSEKDEALILQKKDVLRRFFISIMESGGNYTVRGPLTADLLEQIGLERPFISGCPSMLGHATPNVQFHNSDNSRILLHGDEWIYKFDLPENGTMVDQTSLFQLCFPRHQMDSLKNILSISQANIDILNAKSKRYLIPCNLSSWSSIIQEHSISIGTRIHGTLIALLNHKPAFLFHHDSRTRELANFYGLPTEPLPPNANENELIQIALSSSNAFDFRAITKRVLTIKKEFQEWAIQNKTPFRISESSIPRDEKIILAPFVSKKELIALELYRKIKSSKY